MMYFRQVLAWNIQTTRMFHCTKRKQNISRAILVFLLICVKTSAARLHDKAISMVSLYVGHFFAGRDAQIVIEHEMNVVRQQFFTSALVAHGMQRAFAHFQFVWG